MKKYHHGHTAHPKILIIKSWDDRSSGDCYVRLNQTYLCSIFYYTRTPRVFLSPGPELSCYGLTEDSSREFLQDLWNLAHTENMREKQRLTEQQKKDRQEEYLAAVHPAQTLGLTAYKDTFVIDPLDSFTSPN